MLDWYHDKKELPLESNEWIASLNTTGAFGSGKHESTIQAFLDILEWKHIVPDDSLCDVGCGTGILALAGLRMGFDTVVACDIEHASVESTLKNRQLVHEGAVITVFQGSCESLKSRSFSHVVANIQGDILLSLADDLCRIVKPGGTLLLSGIAWDWLFEIKNSCAKRGFVVQKTVMGETFATVQLTLPAE